LARHARKYNEIVSKRVEVLFHLLKREINKLFVGAIGCECNHIEKEKGGLMPSPVL